MPTEQDSFKIISQTAASKSGVMAGEGVGKPLNILLVELVNPKFQLRNFPLQLFALAGSIAQHAEDGRVKNRLHNVTIAQTSADEGTARYVAQKAQGHQGIDVVGISAHHGNWDCLTKTLSAFREIPTSQRPNLILGGYLASHLHRQLLDGFADLPVAVAVGHGDNAFRSYIDLISLQNDPNGVNDIPGIVSLKRRLLIPARNEASDYPWLDGVPPASANSNKVARMEISRGCFYNGCTFCVRPQYQREWVKYSLDDATRQMVELAEKGYNKFTFSDEEVVGNDPQRFTEFLLRAKELQSEFPDLEFYMNARADNVVNGAPDRQAYLDGMWKLAKDAGVTMVWVGAESYSPRQIKVYNKGAGVSPESNLESLRKLRAVGLSIIQGFIPFHPLMTEAELGENLEFIHKYKETIIPSLDNPLGFLRINPGTRYFEYVLREQERQGITLIKGFDTNTLSYLCSYLDPKLGLLVSFLYSLNTLTRTGTKHIQWRSDTDQRLVQMRYANFDLLSASYRYFTESTSVHSLETQLVANLLPRYQKAVNEIGVDGVNEDLRDCFALEFEKNKSVFTP